ncbi:MAG: cation diffusion facilitator family transporter [Methanotrichaceae archaeon]
MISHPSKSIERRLQISLALTAFILIAEVVGGWWTGSLALLSDAAHVFLDIFALGLSYSALRLSSLPADEHYTYGFHRFEVFASLINGITLVLVSIGIFWEAYHRLLMPEPVKGPELLLIAILGLIVNLFVALVLGSHHHEEHEDANVESALLHVLGDAASSVGVIAAAIIIWRTGWTVVDPLVSILIGVIILAGSWRVIRSSAHIMMEGTPACFDLKDVEEMMRHSSGVTDVHDLHVWNLCSHHAILSAHVVIAEDSAARAQEVMDELSRHLMDDFGIEHSTLQMEFRCCGKESVCRTSSLHSSDLIN